MRENSLFSCPFCGCEKPILMHDNMQKEKLYNYYCPECNASSKVCKKYDDAKKAWNKRTLPKGVTGYITIAPEVLEDWNNSNDD